MGQRRKVIRPDLVVRVTFSFHPVSLEKTKGRYFAVRYRANEQLKTLGLQFPLVIINHVEDVLSNALQEMKTTHHKLRIECQPLRLWHTTEAAGHVLETTLKSGIVK